MILRRNSYVETGIFGTLSDESNSFHYVTLEHAYKTEDGKYIPKIPCGVYKCVRGFHQLEGMDHRFETFEITNVPGHTNLLLHTGNSNQDSAGCVLLAYERKDDVILYSRIAFQSFMGRLNGLDVFELTIE
jgi:hypothetical protein